MGDQTKLTTNAHSIDQVCGLFFLTSYISSFLAALEIIYLEMRQSNRWRRMKLKSR